MIFLIRGYIPLFPISKIIETHSHFLHLSAPAVQAVKPIRIVPGHSRSGHKTQTKKEYLSPRKPLRVLFFFVPGAARFFFSRKRKRNVGRNRSPPLSRGEKTPPRCGAQPFPPLPRGANPRPAAGRKGSPFFQEGQKPL